MENEKFQDLVLEHLAKLTQETTELKQEMKEFKQEMNGFKEEMGEFKQETNCRFDRVESNIQTIKEQTAGLSEFRTEIMEQSIKNQNSIEFLKSRQMALEEEVFRIKQKIS